MIRVMHNSQFTLNFFSAVLDVLPLTSRPPPRRLTFAPAVLASVAFFMTLLNPDILWDVGFRLSFAATFGLTMYIGPWSTSFRSLA